MKIPINTGLRSHLDVALEYAARGWPVIPLLPNGKRPWVKEWQRNGSTDPDQVQAWFDRTPDSNIGQVTGLVHDVIDFDLAKGKPGLAILERLREMGFLDQATAEVRTQSGGRHVYFPAVRGGQPSKAWLHLGVEFKSSGCQVVMPPSVIEGRLYRWAPDLGRPGQPVHLEDLEEALRQVAQPELVEAAAARIGQAPEGSRNTTLNREAWSVAGGDLEVLAEAARANGLSQEEIEATLNSVRSSHYPRQVTKRLTDRFARDEADRLYLEATQPRAEVTIPTLGEVLALPPEPPMRVEGLIPSDGFTEIIGGAKAGKTTFTLNLVQSLLTGRSFLDAFPVVPVQGQVAFLNFEVSNRGLARWAADLGLDHDRLLLVGLRGVGNPLAHQDTREELGRRLRGAGVETLVVDPFSRAFTGLDENATGEVGRFLTDLVQFSVEMVGARDLILTAHTGHDTERVRGNSRLLGDPDSLITLVANDRGERYLRAIGRDVNVPEDRLDFDERTRRFTKSGGGSRSAARAVAKEQREGARTDALLEAVRRVVDREGRIKMGDLTTSLRADAVSFRKGQEQEAVTVAESRGWLRTEWSPGHPKWVISTRISPTLPDPPRNPPRGDGPTTLPGDSLKGVPGGGGVPTSQGDPPDDYRGGEGSPQPEQHQQPPHDQTGQDK